MNDIKCKTSNIISIILAGGSGTRLQPLTLHHSKPSVVYGGRYRLIDIPISNSLNSNINQIIVIGQYLAYDLKSHLKKTYPFDGRSKKLDVLTPKEINGKKILFEGTADAIRKNIDVINKLPQEYVLILSGDQLYNIDFKKMYEFAHKKNADLTIASLFVNENNANRLGILKMDENSFIDTFHEKPKDNEILNSLKMHDKVLSKHKALKKPYLASMGIYIFKKSALLDLLLEDKREDFGKHLIPSQLKKGKTCAYVYDGYWEDIGTIKSFYEANISLALSKCGLKTYDEKNPIFTRAHHIPPSKIKNTRIKESIICEGSIIESKEITRSMIGLRSRLNKNTIIRDSVLLGNLSYTPEDLEKNLYPSIFEIGENTIIEKAIIDEHVKIGKNVKLINKNKLKNYDSDNLYVRDGIIIIPSKTTIEDNFEF